MKVSDIKIQAVVIGLFTDIIGSVCVGILLGFFIAVVAGISGDTSVGHIAELTHNVMLKFIGLLGTTFCTGLGGYVAARLGKPFTRSNALAVGVLSLLLGTILAFLNPGITPLWKIIAGCILTIPAALAGGNIAAKKI